MNLKMAARRLGVHYQTAYRWVRNGSLVAVKVGTGYEISEAALQRFQAQRAALERIPEFEPTPPMPAELDAQTALDILDTMVELTITDATAVYQRAVRFVSEVVQDCSTLHLGPSPDHLRVVAWDHRVPERLVLMSTLVTRGLNDEETYTAQAARRGESIMIPQVPQQTVRPWLKDEWHQFITGSVGYYSSISVPVMIEGKSRGGLLAARDQPGRPVQDDDRAFLDAVAERIAAATVRAERATAAWQVRRTLLERFAAEPTLDADAVRRLVDPGDAVAVVTPGGDVWFVSDAMAELFGTDADTVASEPSATVRVDELAVDLFRRMIAGELDFGTVTLEPVHAPLPVMVHGATVRRPDATPICLFWVAHPVPAPLGGTESVARDH